MKIIVDSKIRIYDPPAKMVADMKEKLTLKNPVYDVLMRRVKYGNQSYKCLYAVKQNFKYYEYDKTLNIFICGRGLLKRIINYCDENNL